MTQLTKCFKVDFSLLKQVESALRIWSEVVADYLYTLRDAWAVVLYDTLY